MDKFQEPDPKVVANEIISRLQAGDEPEWDNIRIDIAGILRLNQDYKKTKQHIYTNQTVALRATALFFSLHKLI